MKYKFKWWVVKKLGISQSEKAKSLASNITAGFRRGLGKRPPIALKDTGQWTNIAEMVVSIDGKRECGHEGCSRRIKKH